MREVGKVLASRVLTEVLMGVLNIFFLHTTNPLKIQGKHTHRFLTTPPHLWISWWWSGIDVCVGEGLVVCGVVGRGLGSCGVVVVR